RRAVPRPEEGLRNGRRGGSGIDRIAGRPARAAPRAAGEEGNAGEGMTATRIFLVRHGATVLSAEDRFAGETEGALSDLGRDQLRKLAARLAGGPIAGFYASPLGRPMETARILAAPHGNAPVTPKDGLREISHGHWEGRTRAEVEKEYPKEYARWEGDPYSFAPPEGETGLSVVARALPTLLEIVAAHAGQYVAVASHKATIRLLIGSLLGFDLRRYRDHLD